MSYGKLIGAKMVEAPKVLNKNGKQYINPPEELYLEYGYLPLEYTTIPNIKNGYHLVQSWINNGNRLTQRWNYEADEKIDNSNLQEKIYQLEEIINALQNPYSISSENIPLGDYMNPILLMEGGLISEKNKWYYINNINKPHRAIIEGFVRPSDFYDRQWFDFI